MFWQGSTVIANSFPKNIFVTRLFWKYEFEPRWRRRWWSKLRGSWSKKETETQKERNQFEEIEEKGTLELRCIPGTYKIIVLDICPKIWIIDQKFQFFTKNFNFLQKISIFYKKFDCRPKIIFFTKKSDKKIKHMFDKKKEKVFWNKKIIFLEDFFFEKKNKTKKSIFEQKEKNINIFSKFRKKQNKNNIRIFDKKKQFLKKRKKSIFLTKRKISTYDKKLEYWQKKNFYYLRKIRFLLVFLYIFL